VNGHHCHKPCVVSNFSQDLMSDNKAPATRVKTPACQEKKRKETDHTGEFRVRLCRSQAKPVHRTGIGGHDPEFIKDLRTRQGMVPPS